MMGVRRYNYITCSATSSNFPPARHETNFTNNILKIYLTGGEPKRGFIRALWIRLNFEDKMIGTIDTVSIHPYFNDTFRSINLVVFSSIVS